MCRAHENFRLKLKGLKVNYDGSYWQDYLCRGEDLNSDCWNGVCTDCKDGKLFKEIVGTRLVPDAPTNWQQWENVAGRLQKMTHTGCVGELLELTLTTFADFRTHVRIKRVQSNVFEHDKETCRVLEIDFAMAYSCEYQSEVQSALWSRASVTLFTAAVFYQGHCKTYLVCSDTKDKDKNAVFAFVTKLYERILIDVPKASPQVPDVIFSDGPSSEFKNKYAMKLLATLAETISGTFAWKYFATSHGVVDGVGGRAKSIVRQKVISKSEDVIVQNSVDFALLVAQLMPATTVIHVSQADIDCAITTAKPWDDVVAIAGIRQMHAAEYSWAENLLRLWHTSDEREPSIEMQLRPDGSETASFSSTVSSVLPNTIKVGDWCVVRYDGAQYLGEVTTVIGDEYEVSVMVRTGNLWKWPCASDSVL